MTLIHYSALARRTYAALALGLSVASAAAVLDVPTPYIPSTEQNVDEMLRLAAVLPGDVVYDLGSGDGRVVIAAARDWGARGVGIELDGKLVVHSREQAKRAGVSDRVSFREGDVFLANVSDASVVTLYLLTSLVHRLQPKLLAELKPGTRIVAHDYGFEGWTPDRHVSVSKNFYLYIVPASVAGKWRIRAALPTQAREYEMDFEQRYQIIKGGARVAGGFLPAYDARLNGDRIAFVLSENDMSYHYEGRVSGAEIEGQVRWGYGPRQQTSTWRATRVAAGG
ncbi:MAG: methyltransferase domain-containing protein [Pseudomonadota bacterium]